MKHGGNGETILSDAPVDNNGKGRKYSPTDMAAVSLASCMMTIVGIRAAKSGIEIKEMRSDVEKIMDSNPRRIGTIKVQMTLECDANEKQREMLIQAAENCPVALSLHPDTKQEIEINFQ